MKPFRTDWATLEISVSPSIRLTDLQVEYCLDLIEEHKKPEARALLTREWFCRPIAEIVLGPSWLPTKKV
jgi:hypothetical protein